MVLRVRLLGARLKRRRRDGRIRAVAEALLTSPVTTSQVLEPDLMVSMAVLPSLRSRGGAAAWCRRSCR
jgi:hypothetical protein